MPQTTVIELQDGTEVELQGDLSPAQAKARVAGLRGQGKLPAIQQPTASESGRLGLGNTEIRADSTSQRFLRGLVASIPGLTGFAGELLGTPGGVPGRIAGGAIGGGGGEAIRQLAARGIFGVGPQTPGEAAGRIAEEAGLQGAGGLIGPGGGKAAKGLRKAAEIQIGRVMAPGEKEAKALVRGKLAPGMLDRGVLAGTRQGLEAQAARKSGKIGAEIGAKEAVVAGNVQSTKQILQDLSEYKKGLFIKGTATPKSAAALSQFEAIEQQVQSMGPNVRRETLRDFRQFLDGEVKKRKGFGIAPGEKTLGEIQKHTADSIRRELNSAQPDIAKLNAEFSFWEGVEEVMNITNQRMTGQGARIPLGLGATISGGAGSVVGSQSGEGGALTGGTIGVVLSLLLTSTAWRTVSANAKNQLAQLLARKDIQGATALVLRMVSGQLQEKD